MRTSADVAPGVRAAPVPAPRDPLSLVDHPGMRDPALVSVRGWTVAAWDPVAVTTDPSRLDELGERCRWRETADPGTLPFLGGAIGYVSDDCSRPWLSLPATDRRPALVPFPPIRFGLYDTACLVTPDGSTAWLVAADIPGRSCRPARDRLEDLRARVAAARRAAAPPAVVPQPSTAGLSLTAPAHAAAVDRILRWITAGDLYQLNLTLQLSTRWRHGGRALARRMWGENPGAAHAAYLGVGGTEIVSVSPETFLRCDGDRAIVRPIKGTRPRRAAEAADAAEAAALRASTKDHAEHVMIVDLERNDLGRVCRTGTVRVPELAALEAHPTVWHLTSTVEGRLRADVGLGTLLASTFPSGSVTGAPKRMAVERTALVEPVRRGVYCGAVGVVSRGLVDLSVAIRTAAVHRGLAAYGAGGGIVADSDPGAEFTEALDKAVAFLRATNTSPP